MKQKIELFPKWNMWTFIFTGSINILIGIRQIHLAASWTDWAGILGILLAIGGLVMTIYGIILLTPSNILAPMVEVNDRGIVIKKEFSKNGLILSWENIKEITYKAFEIDFLLNDDKMETINLQTSAEISIEIKKTIRQVAESRQIKIIGG